MKNSVKLILSIFCFIFTTNLCAQLPEKAEDISPLLIGETLPTGSLQDPDGKTVQLLDIVKEKPTVLVFYRGGWCPYCNVQLSGLVEIEQDILKLGYQIVAVSPDDYKNLRTTIEKDSIKYKLYSDPNGKLINDLGIAFQTPTRIKEYLTSKDNNAKVSEVLPVPTVMILDNKGKILFEFINPNYKERISGEMLLAVLKTIKN